MKFLNVRLTVAAFAASLAFAPAAFACGDGSCETTTPPPIDETPAKGNNGWGNGADATNAGSTSGGTAGSKSINGYGTGVGPTKFTTR